MKNAIVLGLMSACVAGCQGPGLEAPSLQPRAAERIDPRVPIDNPLNTRPVDAALAGRLAALVESARSGEGAFETAIDAARRAAAVAGSPQSESWIVAQEALSAAVEARGPAAIALGSIDAIAAELLAAQGGLAPSDQRAIDEAAATVSTINTAQARAIAAVQASLGG